MRHLILVFAVYESAHLGISSQKWVKIYIPEPVSASVTPIVAPSVVGEPVEPVSGCCVAIVEEIVCFVVSGVFEVFSIFLVVAEGVVVVVVVVVVVFVVIIFVVVVEE